MNYETMATQRTPALIIYLLDVSGSMSRAMGKKMRIEVVTDSLTSALRQMVFRSTKGGRLSPRYRVAMLAYSDHVYDLLDGVKSIEHVAKLGIPNLSTQRSTETAKAFIQAEKILMEELPNLQSCPAPLICHMTDGEYTGADPAPIVERIKQIAVPDGPVLVENIFISGNITPEPIADPANWPGIMPETTLENEYARKLRDLSSPIPDSYRAVMLEFGYRLGTNARMLFPGTSPELVSLGFQMSAATPVR
ncbi:MAG: vWA domain-containing protein [Syntrophomonadaceae bacterium]